MGRHAFAHLVEVAVPLNLAEVVRHIEQTLLPYLKRLGYLHQREGHLYAGPMLDSLDDLKATERAREYMVRYKRMAHLQRRAEEIDKIRRSADEAQRC